MSYYTCNQCHDVVKIKNDLEKPFPPNRIHWRCGKRSNDKGIALAYIDARDVICEIGLKIDGEWIWRANGAGDTQFEAEKGKASDAFKRAAVMWGVGRYLYSLPNVWVSLGSRGQIVEPPELPAWATPEGYEQIMEANKEALNL
jgi:hypothetical protein